LLGGSERRCIALTNIGGIDKSLACGNHGQIDIDRVGLASSKDLSDEAPVAVAVLNKQLKRAANREQLSKVSPAGDSLRSLRAFRSVNTGQANTEPLTRESNSQGVAITDGNQPGARGVGMRTGAAWQEEHQ
jgi:hypothetical protein